MNLVSLPIPGYSFRFHYLYYFFTGILFFIQDVLSSHLAGLPSSKPAKNASPVAHCLAAAHINAKALKMAVYGALIAAPLSHYLASALQRIFAGKTSRGAKAAYILCNNTFVAPITTAGES